MEIPGRVPLSVVIRSAKTAMCLLLIFAALPSGVRAQSTPAPAQQNGNQDCEEIKKNIEELQALMAQISAEIQRLTQLLDQVNQHAQQMQADFKSRSFFFSGEEIRGQYLDAIAKELALRNKLQQQLADDANLIQAIKEEIADLLNKLGNCAPPSNTQPPKQETPNPQPPPPSTTPQKNKSVSMSGFTPAIQFRGFGGATFVNGNTPATAGFDGAVLFPLGNRVLVGPTAGFQWVESSIIKTIGGGPPPSTFINTSVGFKSGNFGGRIGFPFGGWEIGITGGATVAGSTMTQATGFCGGTGGSLPPDALYSARPPRMTPSSAPSSAATFPTRFFLMYAFFLIYAFLWATTTTF